MRLATSGTLQELPRLPDDSLVRTVTLTVADPSLSSTGKRITPQTVLDRPIQKLVLLTKLLLKRTVIRIMMRYRDSLTGSHGEPQRTVHNVEQ